MFSIIIIKQNSLAKKENNLEGTMFMRVNEVAEELGVAMCFFPMLILADRVSIRIDLFNRKPITHRPFFQSSRNA